MNVLPSRTIRKAIRVVEFGRRNNVSVDFDEAQEFLRARSKLAANPKDGEAIRLMSHFESVFRFAGSDPEDFSVFIHSPECPPGCPECAERRRRRETK